MRLDVALLPGLVREGDAVFAVVDVLRASSTIVTLLDRGVPSIVPAATPDQARELRRRLSGHLLCGEVNGLPPPDFDCGNSPVEFAVVEDPRPAILATSNGTRILNDLADAPRRAGVRPPAVLVGALLNREAAAAALLRLASERGDDVSISIVCAAAPSGRSIALEDALGAGAIAEAALRLDGSLAATDAALFARDAFLAARGDLPGALASSRHGKELIEAGLAGDVGYCARLDVSPVVPLLHRDGEAGLLTLRPYVRP